MPKKNKVGWQLKFHASDKFQNGTPDFGSGYRSLSALFWWFGAREEQSSLRLLLPRPKTSTMVEETAEGSHGKCTCNLVSRLAKMSQFGCFDHSDKKKHWPATRSIYFALKPSRLALEAACYCERQPRAKNHACCDDAALLCEYCLAHCKC